MDEEIKAQLIPIIEGAKNGLAVVVETLQEQAPLPVKEILWWESIQSAIWFFGSIIIVVVLCCNWSKAKQTWITGTATWDENSPPCFAVPCIAIVCGWIVCPIITACHITWLQILIAPRLFLLEYVAKWF